MEYIFTLINSNIGYAPIIVFACLVISGFGAAISEDALVIASGVLASQYPQITIPLYIAIVLGAFGGDNVTYWVARKSGDKILASKLFANEKRMSLFEKMRSQFASKGPLIIIVGRFIPFGIRMLIYITAGITKFNYKVFVVVEIIAAALTTGITFFLAVHFGDAIIEAIDSAKYALAITLGIVLAIVVVKKVFAKKPIA